MNLAPEFGAKKNIIRNKMGRDVKFVLNWVCSFHKIFSMIVLINFKEKKS